MMASAILFIVTSYPAFMLVAGQFTGHASLAVLIATVCWFGFLKSLFSGALPSLMAKIFPVATRVSAMSLAYNIGVPVFGGFAPLAAQALIDITGSKLAPSYYMIGTALISLAALIALQRRHNV
jgi:MHS family proline/betaine transporter-like MFS transporter